MNELIFTPRFKFTHDYCPGLPDRKKQKLFFKFVKHVTYQLRGSNQKKNDPQIFVGQQKTNDRFSTVVVLVDATLTTGMKRHDTKKCGVGFNLEDVRLSINTCLHDIRKIFRNGIYLARSQSPLLRITVNQSCVRLGIPTHIMIRHLPKNYYQAF